MIVRSHTCGVWLPVDCASLMYMLCTFDVLRIEYVHLRAMCVITRGF